MSHVMAVYIGCLIGAWVPTIIVRDSHMLALSIGMSVGSTGLMIAAKVTGVL